MTPAPSFWSITVCNALVVAALTPAKKRMTTGVFGSGIWPPFSNMRRSRRPVLPNGLELSCPAEAGRLSLIVALAVGPGALPYAPARRVSFSELLGSTAQSSPDTRKDSGLHLCFVVGVSRHALPQHSLLAWNAVNRHRYRQCPEPKEEPVCRDQGEAD